MGASFGVSPEEVRALLDVALGQLGLDASAVTAIATVDAQAREPGLAALAADLAVPLVPYPAAELARVPNPSPAAGRAAPATAQRRRGRRAARTARLAHRASRVPRSSCWSARPPARGPPWRWPGTGWPTCATTATPSCWAMPHPAASRPERRRGLRDFAVNVSTDPLPDWLAEAIATACGQLAGYPRPQAATAAATARHRRLTGEVLLTAGASEAFTLLAQGIPAGRAAVVHPQFTEPEVALRAAGWRVRPGADRPGRRLGAAPGPGAGLRRPGGDRQPHQPDRHAASPAGGAGAAPSGPAGGRRRGVRRRGARRAGKPGRCRGPDRRRGGALADQDLGAGRPADRLPARRRRRDRRRRRGAAALVGVRPGAGRRRRPAWRTRHFPRRTAGR